MKKWVAVVLVISFMLCSSGVAIGSDANPMGPIGPAPNSGDGIPDGSGFTAPNGPHGNQTQETVLPTKFR